MNRFLPGIAMTTVAVLTSAVAAAGGRFQADAYYDQARVVHADPVVEIVRVDDPREICWTESATRRSPRRRAYGHDVYNRPVERCEIRHDYYEEERVVGYDVRYQYNGRVYHTRMDRDPGPRVRVRVNVAVAE